MIWNIRSNHEYRSSFSEFSVEFSLTADLSFNSWHDNWSTCQKLRVFTLFYPLIHKSITNSLLTHYRLYFPSFSRRFSNRLGAPFYGSRTRCVERDACTMRAQCVHGAYVPRWSVGTRVACWTRLRDTRSGRCSTRDKQRSPSAIAYCCPSTFDRTSSHARKRSEATDAMALSHRNRHRQHRSAPSIDRRSISHGRKKWNLTLVERYG